MIDWLSKRLDQSFSHQNLWTIIYQDEHIVVVDKPSGFLSVPGRGIEKIDSVAHQISTNIPGCIDQPAVHRLDMDTSGILVLALTKDAHRNLGQCDRYGRVEAAA